MDVDCSGFLDLHEFGVALKQLGVNLSQAQVELIFSAIDQDGSGEIECEEFLDVVFCPTWTPAEGADEGLAKWGTWTKQYKSTAQDVIGDIQDASSVLRGLHDRIQRPAGGTSWPSSILQPVGWRSDAAMARREREQLHSRSLPAINPVQHPAPFFASPVTPQDTSAQEKRIRNVLQSWNTQWLQRNSAPGKSVASPGQQVQRSLRVFETIAGLRPPPGKEEALWISTKSVQDSHRGQVARLEARVTTARERLAAAQKQLNLHMALSMAEMNAHADHDGLTSKLEDAISTSATELEKAEKALVSRAAILQQEMEDLKGSTS